MPQSTDHFYQQLPAFTRFGELAQSNHYRPVPDDWLIAMTEVAGSTQAIHNGQYRQVNALAVASIAAVTRALEPLRIPYGFDGNGATFCFPESQLTAVKQALRATQKLASNGFSLRLRAGIVPVKDLRDAGADISVAKYQPSSHNQQSLMLGDGIAKAKAWIRDKRLLNPYQVRPDTRLEPAEQVLFDGLEYRWQEVHSPHEAEMALAVSSLGGNAKQQEEVFAKILHDIDYIYGDEVQRLPLSVSRLRLTNSVQQLGIEARIRTGFSPRVNSWLYLLRLQLNCLLERCLMHNGLESSLSAGQGTAALLKQTRTHQFESALSIILSGTHEQHGALRERLETYQEQGLLIYGAHTGPSLSLTALDRPLYGERQLFIDISNGGRTLANRELERQRLRASK